MKKLLSLILVFVIILTSLSLTAFAQKPETLYCFDSGNGDHFYYYKDNNDNTYIIDNGNKYYIEIPEYTEQVTDEAKLKELRDEFNSHKISNNAKSVVIFSQTVYFNTLAKTGILNVTDNYLYLKCTNLNPSNAKRGFSYWIFYSTDGRDWTRSFYANKSLSVYTRHAMAELGNAPYIKIEIFSYYGTVSSCLFSVKQGGILGWAKLTRKRWSTFYC